MSHTGRGRRIRRRRTGQLLVRGCTAVVMAVLCVVLWRSANAGASAGETVGARVGENVGESAGAGWSDCSETGEDPAAEALYEAVDGILSEILTEEMSDYDRLWAIYSYVNKNVKYDGNVECESALSAAEEGLTKHRGDCYVFACLTGLFLDRAGIRNMDIAKIPAETDHYWNLVDIGEGWRHLDTCPRVDHPTIFYWTDEELMAYSREHKDSHNYDREKYPEIP